MTVLSGDTGRVSQGPLKTVTAARTTVFETQLTPADLPLSAFPATPQISFTIAAGDLPTVTGAVGFETNAVMVAAGRNTTASSVNIFWRVRKNGTAQFSGSFGIAANQYWTWMAYHYANAVVGDILEMSLYASVAGVTHSFSGCFTLPSKIDIGSGRVIIDAVVSVFDTQAGDPAPFTASAGGMFLSSSDTDLRLYPLPTTITSVSLGSAGPYSIKVFQNHAAHKTGQTGASVSPSATAGSSATNIPYYLMLRYITKITYRELIL